MMQIDSKLEPKIVTDYDFTLEGGVGLPVTIDLKLGDTIEFSPDEVKINLSPKPYLSDATKFSPKQSLTIKDRKILAYAVTEREIYPRTPEEQVEWEKSLKARH